MPSSKQVSGRPYWNSGRGFATMDPERQVEVLGYVRNTPIETTVAARPAPAKPAQRSWLRAQPDVESGFEGSSSRRWR